jgi:hypothetical protein
VVAAVLTPPAGSSLIGRPVTLVEALMAARERSQQLQVTRAYWRLTAAAGDYRLGWDASEQLRRIEVKPKDVLLVRSARASALASLGAAEAAVAWAQRELAEAARLALKLPPPLPADLPHVGPYRTNFDEVYARQSVPIRARLIHRAMPLRRQAIELRSQAVIAADDAAQTAIEEAADPPVAVACITELADQRRALIAQVCRYNEEIAEYVLSVVGSPLSGPALVTMLIKSGTAPATAPAGGREPAASPVPWDKRSALPEGSAVQPATFLEPMAPSELGSDRPAAGRGPTLAPPPDLPPETKVAQPRFVPRYEPRADSAPPLGPDPEGFSQPAARTARRLIADLPGRAAGGTALESSLTNPSAAVRAKQLSLLFHTGQSPAAQAGQAVKLQDCLRSLVAGDRRGAIDAYWLAAQRAAQCQALAQQAEWLRQLEPLAVDRGTQAGGALGMLRLRAARLAAEAALADAQAELLEAQFLLTWRVGRPPETPWLAPSTPPHAGPYQLLQPETLRPEVVQSAALRRLSAAIPALSTRLQQQADVIAEAERSRASAASAYQIGTTGPIDPLLPAIRCQTLEILGFLTTLTAYNQAIAEYALLVLPPTITPDDLVQSLVVVN